MPRPAHPWWRTDRKMWCVTFRGKTVSLGITDPNDRAGAEAAFRVLTESGRPGLHLPRPANLFFCEKLLVDAATKKPTACGIFSDLCCPLPIRLDFFVILLLNGTTRPITVLMQLFDPAGSPAQLQTMDFPTAAPHEIHGMFAGFTRVAFTAPGAWPVRATIDGVVIAEQPIWVCPPAGSREDTVPTL